MCKLIHENKYDFISLNEDNKMFKNSAEKMIDKVLEETFFNELIKKEDSLISKDNFGKLQLILQVAKVIEKLNNSLGSLIYNSSNETDKIKEKRRRLVDAYSYMNSILDNTKL